MTDDKPIYAFSFEKMTIGDAQFIAQLDQYDAQSMIAGMIDIFSRTVIDWSNEIPIDHFSLLCEQFGAAYEAHANTRITVEAFIRQILSQPDSDEI